MKEKRNDIAILVSLISVIMVFIFGITQWKKYATSDLLIGKHLYYITVSYVMYALSFISLLQARKMVIKIASSITFALFGTNIYVEFFGNPEDWGQWDKTMFVVFLANLLLRLFIIERIKTKK